MTIAKIVVGSGLLVALGVLTIYFPTGWVDLGRDLSFMIAHPVQYGRRLRAGLPIAAREFWRWLW